MKSGSKEKGVEQAHENEMYDIGPSLYVVLAHGERHYYPSANGLEERGNTFSPEARGVSA